MVKKYRVAPKKYSVKLSRFAGNCSYSPGLNVSTEHQDEWVNSQIFSWAFIGFYVALLKHPTVKYLEPSWAQGLQH